MSKQIFVQAQADHIASLSKATPVQAIEELVWNALDADAREVKIDLVTNPLGGIEAVRISDDGSGVDVLKIDGTFGSLGGSWKLAGGATAAYSRRLHGRHGRGRFKAFALGTSAEWRTTVSIGGNLLSYTISGAADEPGVFRMDAAQPGPATGTEVYVAGVKSTCDSLLDASETVQALASKFALYLKSYPDVRIYFNGLPVTPVIVQRKSTVYDLDIPDTPRTKLEIIEWKRKFAGSGKLVFAGPDGFQLYERPALVRSGGASFTAYLVSSRFPALAAENELVMDELDPETRKFLDAARKRIKTHFSAAAGERLARLIDSWKDEGSYPDMPEGDAKARRDFDSVAAELVERYPSFASMQPEERGVLFRLLSLSLPALKNPSLKEILGKGKSK